jgi:hypothetical protein
VAVGVLIACSVRHYWAPAPLICLIFLLKALLTRCRAHTRALQDGFITKPLKADALATLLAHAAAQAAALAAHHGGGGGGGADAAAAAAQQQQQQQREEG